MKCTSIVLASRTRWKLEKMECREEILAENGSGNLDAMFPSRDLRLALGDLHVMMRHVMK